jgi:hypothetical protein
MKFINLRDKVEQGYHPVVRFKKTIEDMDTYFEKEMMAKIVNISHDCGDHFSIVFSVKNFNDHNAILETANYYDTHGDGCLTATEANMHPRRNHMCEDVYFMNNDRVEEWFEIVSDDGTELFGQYESMPRCGMSYVQWLEARVKQLEAELI